MLAEDDLTKTQWSLLVVATATTVDFGKGPNPDRERLVELGLIEKAEDGQYRATTKGELAVDAREEEA